MLDESTDIIVTVEKRLSISVKYVKFGVMATKLLINVPLVDGRHILLLIQYSNNVVV